MTDQMGRRAQIVEAYEDAERNFDRARMYDAQDDWESGRCVDLDEARDEYWECRRAVAEWTPEGYPPAPEGCAWSPVEDGSFEVVPIGCI